MPQEGALFPHLTVEANVGFGLSRRERRGGARRGAAGDGRHRAPRAQRCRTSSPAASSSASRSRARSPAGRAALLLDEPFSSLDATLRNHVREEVHALLRAQGVTTVLVTHDQEEALSLADIVAVLRDGTIVQQGTPAELYEQPADERLARFLGAVNVIPAEFAHGEAAHAAGHARAARRALAAGERQRRR